MKNLILKKGKISGLGQNGIFSNVWFFCLLSITPFKYGRNFILVLLNHMIKKKIEKSHPEKRLDFRVGSKWLNFYWLKFLGLSTLGSIISDILSTISQISWIFQNTPNFCNLMVLKGVMDKKQKNQTLENMPFWVNPEI